MIYLAIPEMTCGHCVSVITQAVKSEDAQARLAFDLPSNTVQIESNANVADLIDAIEATGYTVALPAANEEQSSKMMADNY